MRSPNLMRQSSATAPKATPWLRRSPLRIPFCARDSKRAEHFVYGHSANDAKLALTKHGHRRPDTMMIAAARHDIRATAAANRFRRRRAGLDRRRGSPLARVHGPLTRVRRPRPMRIPCLCSCVPNATNEPRASRILQRHSRSLPAANSGQQRIKDVHRIVAAAASNRGTFATGGTSHTSRASVVDVVVLLVFLGALLIHLSQPHVKSRRLGLVR